jgi:hypothetical protein
MAISKVIFNGDTLMDVTGDNPSTDNMLTGTKATGADGRSVNGAVVTAPASDDNPAMDGVASPGSASTYSRGDHVHPKDTTKLDKSGGTLTGALTLSGAPTANLHAATKKYVDDAIGGINSFEYEVVQSLPTTNIKDHTIYLVPKTGTTGDVYDEYLRISNAWEHIGSTDVDLSGYVPTSRTVNGKALSSNITLTENDVLENIFIAKYGETQSYELDEAFDLGKNICCFYNNRVYLLYLYDRSDSYYIFISTKGTEINEIECYNSSWSTSPSQPSLVRETRTINSKSLSSNITLTASDVGALPSSTVIPSATSTTPIMDGTAAVGTEATFAKGDHVHPSDTSKVSKSGDTMTGDLSFASGKGVELNYNNTTTKLTGIGSDGGTPIIGFNKSTRLRWVGSPTIDSDATNKQYVDTAVSAKQSKPTIISATLAVASWSNGVYSFESTYPNASYNIDIEPDGSTITDAQFSAWCEAKIVGSSAGNTIKALGTVPTVAIPVVVRATPK